METPDYNAANDKTTSMQTLTEVMAKAVADGFTANFSVTKKGICTDDETKCYQPDDITVSNYYRFEGESDPGDNAIMFAIETNDGIKGTLVDAYGTYSESFTTTFMKRVDDMRKH